MGTIDTARSVQFGRDITLLLQQKDSRFGQTVMVEALTGKRGSFDRIGPTAAKKRTSRHADTPLIKTEHDRRWVFASFYEWADLIDEADRIQLIADPQGPYVQNGMAAMHRAMDDEIVEAFYGDAKTGEEANGTAAFDTVNQVVAVTVGNGGAGNVGMNAAKLKAARKIFRRNEVDESEEMYCGINSDQFEDLLNDDEVVNRDYTLINKLDDGEIVKFMGFNFVPSERLPVDSNGFRRNPVWVKSGMILAFRKNTTGRVSERDDKSYSTQVYACQDVGAVRTEEKKVVEIKCNEA